METYTIQRTGDVPLVFEGECLAETSTHRLDGRERNRWYEVDLYRTAGGRYVVAVTYQTQWQGEASVSRPFVCDSAADVRSCLLDFDPLGDVAGYPPGDAYAEKQARLERGLRLDWQTVVKDLFARVPDPAEFAERVA